MTMSNQHVRTATDPEPYGWRAATFRVLANALLALLAFESVSLVYVVATIAMGATLPATPVELVLLVAVFVLARWVFVLPGLLVVLVGIEYVARRVPHGRVLTAIVAFAPMVLWEVTKSPGGISELGGLSEQGLVLGVTAVLFAVVARLPTRVQGESADDLGATQPPAETAIAPR
jgi:hypothetical protein